MATKNPRISVMLKPETDVILSRLSAVSKQSKSSIIADFIEDTCMPMFERMVIVLEAAANASEDAKAAAKQGFVDAEKKLLDVVGITTDLFDQAAAPIMNDERAPRRRTAGRTDGTLAGAAARPPHVTRGSGTPNRPNKAPTKPTVAQKTTTLKAVKRASKASQAKGRG